jgi:N-acetylglutamate synthase-like GNAT family acetyltransferase
LSSRYGLEIRRASSADAAGLCELFGSAGLTITPRSMAERLEALQQRQGVVLLALEWGPPSGMIALHWHQTLTADQPAAQISTLLVHPDRRRSGIGRLLVKAAGQTARAAGCGELELLSLLGSADLLDFCRASGFAEAGPRFVRPLRRRG